MNCQTLKEAHSESVTCRDYLAGKECVAKGEHQRKYRISLKDNQEICIVDLDNKFWKNLKRPDGSHDKVADKMLICCDKHTLILVEFKGQNYSDAINQLIATIGHLENNKMIPTNWQVHARVVLKSVPAISQKAEEKIAQRLSKYRGKLDKGSGNELKERLLQL